MRPPLSQLAEQALWSMTTIKVKTNPAEFAVLRVPAIVENYVDSLLETLAAEYLDGNAEFERSVGQLVREKLHQNWPSRREWLGKSFGISVHDQRVNQDFLLLVQLRNAMTHGLGTFTRQQKSTLGEQLRLEREFHSRLQVKVDGPHIEPTAGTAVIALRIGNQFVKEVDAEAVPVLRRQKAQANMGSTGRPRHGPQALP